MGRTQWPKEIDGMATILEDGVGVKDLKSLDTKELLIEMLTELKKIEYHLMLASDADLTNFRRQKDANY